MCINLFVSGKKFAKKVKLKILTIEKENDFFVGLQFPGKIVKRSQISIFGFSICSQKYTKG